jgi:hypothetical protein
VSEAVIAEAQRIRNIRDSLYGNIYGEEDTDLRWVGEVGEICFDRWLAENCAVGHEWISDQKAAGKPDFLISPSVPVGLKTVKRKVPVRRGFEAQITARHATEEVDWFFFASYEYLSRQLTLIGGIQKLEFLRLARYFGPGEKVHAHYTIRRGHEIYNLYINHLTGPLRWVNEVCAAKDPPP